MKKPNLLLLSLLLLAGLSYGQSPYTESFSVKVTNGTVDRAPVMIHIPQDKLPKKFNSNAFAVFEGQSELPSQHNVRDRDYQGIVVVIDQLRSDESKTLVVRWAKTGEVKHSYPKRTQAELSHKTGGEWKAREYIGGTFKNVDYLRVPKEHKDHSWFIRYEGPGWESDKVGYRLYLDQRNAVDVFGKRVTEPVLQKVGQDGFDSYHELQDWGMDVLKVAKSLGVGSIGTLVNGSVVRVEKTDSVTCRITENGDVYSSFQTRYLGWNVGQSKVDVDSRISIHAGTRLTHNRIAVKGTIDNLVTGLIKDDKAKPRLFSNRGDASSFGYIATYGAQSLNNNDNLGIVVFFNPSYFKEFTEDQFNHIVKLAPSKGNIDYYYAGVWQLEHEGITDEAGFVKYVEQTAKELASPVKVEVLKK